MFDAVVSALFRSVVDEACAEVPAHETGSNALVASQPPEAPPKSELNADKLSGAGRKVLLPPPSMWN